MGRGKAGEERVIGWNRHGGLDGDVFRERPVGCIAQAQRGVPAET
jgi:hypothetical protein